MSELIEPMRSVVRLPPTGVTARSCEFGQALLDLKMMGSGGNRTSGPVGPCSAEKPVAREHPLPPKSGAPYVLCNGHLRDLFGVREPYEALNAAPAA